MRAPASLPQRPRRVPRGRPALVITVLVLVVALTSLRGIAGFWTDFLWFDQLGFGSVFTGILGAKITLAVVFVVLTFVVLLVNLIVADRIAPRQSAGPQDELVQRYREAVGRHAGKVRVTVAVLFGLFLGIGQSSQWNAYLLYRNYQPFTDPTTHKPVNDAQFHRNVGFYVFKLPFLQNLVGWAFGAVLVVTFVTAVFHYLNGGIKLQTPNPAQRVSPQVKAHISVLLGVLALIKGAGYYLQQYSLVLSTRGKVKGALYTDVHAQLPAFKLLMFISLIAFVLLLANIYLRGWTLPALGVGLWFLVSVTAGAIYPAIIQTYTVKPVENPKELPYIQRNITATRDALGLSQVTTKDFPANVGDATTGGLTAPSLTDNAGTVRNIRLWDPNIAPRTYQPLQEIRGYYRFNDADVDRYPLANQLTQTLLSVRELNQGGLPGGNSWVNQHLIYTHGFGAVLSPTNAVAAGGLPVFDIKDIPPVTVGPPGTPTLDQPRIYFGKNTSAFSIVGSKSAELDFEDPKTNRPQTSHYDGKGGVGLSSLTRKLAFALRFSDKNLIFSSAITPKSRILYVRDVAARVQKAAPFLKLDADPYAVIVGQPGAQHVVWVQDAYTTTDRYPYSENFDNSTQRLSSRSGLQVPFNYIRNSVKATVDAYDGTVTFYVFDKTDPIVNAYRAAFPKLFRDASEMPAGLGDHLRFPEDLFRAQTTMWGHYHLLDAAAFYQGGDYWDVAQDPGVGAVSTATSLGAPVVVNGRVQAPTGSRRQDPFYLLMRLPNEQAESFLILQPMVASSQGDKQQNMTAFMVAKSDPGAYGQIEAYRMLQGQLVPGPAQVDSVILQNPDVSRDISLLNTQGSEVDFGNLLTIPVNNSLLYVRPEYVSSKGAGTAIPSLKKVIVVYGGQVAYEDTLQQALTKLFPGLPAETQEQFPRGSAPSTGGGGTTTTPPATGSSQNVTSLLTRAQQDFVDANKALAQNPPDFATYSQKIQDAQKLIGQAAAASGAGTGASSTTTTSPPSAPGTSGAPGTSVAPVTVPRSPGSPAPGPPATATPVGTPATSGPAASGPAASGQPASGPAGSAPPTSAPSVSPATGAAVGSEPPATVRAA